MALRSASKAWTVIVEEVINRGGADGEMLVHDGNDISKEVAGPREGRRKLVTRDIFLLNITKVGDFACYYAVNLVVVDIPEGVESIGSGSFERCSSLTTVYFPTTFSFIDYAAFAHCSSLDNVDLLHTNLQELGQDAFYNCRELKSMTIPDSLQTLGDSVFVWCDKLVPSNIDVGLCASDSTTEVVAHLRSLKNSNNSHTKLIISRVFIISTRTYISTHRAA